MLHVLIFCPLKNRRDKNFDPKISNLFEARRDLTPPFGILKKILQNETCETFGVNDFWEKIVSSPGDYPNMAHH